MPISGPSSYVPTCQVFLAHWAEVNAALTSPDVLTLSGQLVGQGTVLTRANFETLYEALVAQRTVVTEALVDLDFARGDWAELKGRLVQRIGEIIALIRGNVPGSKWDKALPLQPDTDAASGVLEAAATRVNKVWATLLDGPGASLGITGTLQGGYTQGMFLADLETISTISRAVVTAGATAKLEQEERNDMQDKIYPILKAYRQVMPAKVPPGDALTDSLPLLTPLPGSTPEPVALTAVLDGPTQQARLTWTASGNAALDHYEVRAVPGDTYNSDDEVAVASIDKDAPRTLLTDHFLTDPGQTASYKVYVVLTTENEAGSNAESVTRPV